MKYWETFFLTVGAGMMVGAVVSPGSWLALILGVACAFVGYNLHKNNKENER